MTRIQRAPRTSVAPALCAVVFLAGLAGLVIKRRTDCLRSGYEAHRLMEVIGHLGNEKRYIEGELGKLRISRLVRERCKQIGLEGGGTSDIAPPEGQGGVGQ